MSLRLLYPSDPLNPAKPDEIYAAEHAAARRLGIAVSVFELETLDASGLRAQPAIEMGDVLVYRGWMLDAAQYAIWVSAAISAGAKVLTVTARYLGCHHLPNWYPLVREWTPETLVVPATADLRTAAAELGWPQFFVKDYVKSLTTARGSIASSPEEVVEVASLIQKYRGRIEGGICLRRVESFVASSERRYFVYRGTAHSATGAVPPLVHAIANRIDSPFYSVDVAETPTGELRLIELGDGQVSDIKEWSAEDFVGMFSE